MGTSSMLATLPASADLPTARGGEEFEPVGRANCTSDYGAQPVKVWPSCSACFTLVAAAGFVMAKMALGVVLGPLHWSCLHIAGKLLNHPASRPSRRLHEFS